MGVFEFMLINGQHAWNTSTGTIEDSFQLDNVQFDGDSQKRCLDSEMSLPLISFTKCNCLTMNNLGTHLVIIPMYYLQRSRLFAVCANLN